MIFLFQFLPLLLPLNRTFTCHKIALPISIAGISRILDVEIEYRKSPSPPKEMIFSSERNDILEDTAHKKLTKFAGCRGNQESCISEDITYRKVG